jgi:hypothetical protein
MTYFIDDDKITNFYSKDKKIEYIWVELLVSLYLVAVVGFGTKRYLFTRHYCVVLGIVVFHKSSVYKQVLCDIIDDD